MSKTGRIEKHRPPSLSSTVLSLKCIHVNHIIASILNKCKNYFEIFYIYYNISDSMLIFTEIDSFKTDQITYQI